MKGRKNRASGGDATYKEDKAPSDVYAGASSNVVKETKERKHGGKTVKMHGAMASHHMGRKPRKSGGRTGSNMNPLSSAHSGTPAKGRGAMAID